ncbi:hypothetical protein ACHWQZ_G017430 [Mnemiopsis leidyi]
MNSSFVDKPSTLFPAFILPERMHKFYGFQCLVFYLVAARLVTVFYLRTFSFTKHGRNLAADLGILLLLQCQHIYYLGKGSAALTIIGLFWAERQYNNNELIIDQKIKLLVTAIGLYTANTAPLPSLHLFSMLGATTQFLRNPVWLRDMLREPRLVCGPLHPIMVVATGRYLTMPVTKLEAMTSLFYFLAILSVIAAAGILRPDNVQVLRLLPARLQASFNTQAKRRIAHAVLMLLSLVFMTVNSFFHPAITPCQKILLYGLFAEVLVMFCVLKLGMK